MSFPWFVVQTRAGQERAVSRAIEQIETVDVFFPTIRRTIHTGRRVEAVIRPLFPLYLFAAFDVRANSWGQILRTVGVHTILGINRRPGFPVTFLGAKPIANGRYSETPPIPVPDYVITALQAAAALGGGHVPIMEKFNEPLRRLVPDERVRVIEGPFDGFSGLVDRDQKTRVWVLLDILGKERPTLVPREALAPELSAAQ